MQEYLHKTRLSEKMDTLGFHLLALLLSLGFFLLLWGLRLSALSAGFSLYILILLLRRKTRDGRLIRKEKKLRARIGGELALERLLLSPADQAHFEIAMLISLQKPLQLLRSGNEGMLCSQDEEKFFIVFAQLPLSSSLGAEKVLSVQRAAKARGAARALLCAPCKISPEARTQAAGEIPVSFMERDEMIALFGAANPATDGQLVQLGKRRKNHPPARKWLRLIFDPRRAPRYALYSGLLLSMYLLTRLPYYIAPGLICAFLAAFCRCFSKGEKSI
ncbi:MAG: hypothetical protein E7336_01370 [Clostridiales bacterium]|nr:hypothetical protein [Clostridiales bacterium]